MILLLILLLTFIDLLLTFIIDFIFDLGLREIPVPISNYYPHLQDAFQAQSKATGEIPGSSFTLLFMIPIPVTEGVTGKQCNHDLRARGSLEGEQRGKATGEEVETKVVEGEGCSLTFCNILVLQACFG